MALPLGFLFGAGAKALTGKALLGGAAKGAAGKALSGLAPALLKTGLSSIGGIAQGLLGGGERRREQKAAEAEFNRMKGRYEALDTSNPYKNITNTFEDLTVNTQAAEFAQQQAEQSRANILGDLAASAGGGGIAALAQSLANQQTQAAQAAAASIGQQEQRNQMLAAQGEAKMQQMKGKGEFLSQQMEMRKTGTLLGMSQQRLAAANEARQQAGGGLAGAIGQAVGGVGALAAIGGKATPGAEGVAGQKGLFGSIGRGLEKIF